MAYESSPEHSTRSLVVSEKIPSQPLLNIEDVTIEPIPTAGAACDVLGVGVTPSVVVEVHGEAVRS